MTKRAKATAKTAANLAENIADFNVRDAMDNVTDFGERVQTRASNLAEQVRSRLGDMDETTIPDKFKNVPKFISPSVHAWLDFGVVTYFAGVSAWCAIRGKGGAALAALLNGGMVAGVSLMTDYEGSGEKPISFKLHGTLDALQAATAALAPVLHGFAGEPEAAYFYGQAANELGVIAATDWDAGMPARKRRKAA